MPSAAAALHRRIEATIAFVDLAGFTALTVAHGDEDAARLATSFAEITRGALGPGDRLIKTLGDAVLVTSETPEGGVALVDRVLTLAAAENGFPALRAGLHHGPVIAHGGDVFGAAVNLASRVANEAYAGEVLGTEPIAAAARAEGIPVIDLGAVSLKNVSAKVPLFSLAIVVGATDETIDPVCRTPVDRHVAAGRLSYRGVEHWFCSLSCAAAFASNPSWHVGAAKRSR
ncbi:MAG TPA: adenylate/guanylate cyclase domain-containing protein [Minicystis sp.]|nr:adenylate/guanylate cyclase domain-containing protein [Minicystis sp.]